MVCIFVVIVIKMDTFAKLHQKVMPKQKSSTTTARNLMTIKRDKFSSIIQILELDIFDDCHLAMGQHDDVTHEHALCVSVVSSSFIALTSKLFLVLCVVRTAVHALKRRALIASSFILISGSARNTQLKPISFVPMFMTTGSMARDCFLYFHSHFVIDNDAMILLKPFPVRELLFY